MANETNCAHCSNPLQGPLHTHKFAGEYICSECLNEAEREEEDEDQL